LMIVLSDQGANLVKNSVQRPRPCNNPALYLNGPVITPDGCGGPFGFFSGHASNSFALAMIVALLMRRKNIDHWKQWLWMFAWALVVGWSRIYMGVHYPLDVISGAIYGCIIAVVTYILITRFYLDKRNA
jgi:undecaprenyl-diphosphatase